MRILKKIVVDNRQDWPTNGGALAILQYAHLGLSNHQIFQKIEKNNIYDLFQKFSKKAEKLETKKHVFEALQLIEMARFKMQNIQTILNN